MQVETITIENFRGIRAGTIYGFTDVNLLIGRNNCGKSTVIEALMRVLWEKGQVEDILGRPFRDIWQRIRQDPEHLPREIWYRQDQSRPIVLSVDLQLPSQQGKEKVNLKLKIDSKPSRIPSELSVAPLSQPNVLDKFAKGMTLFRPMDAMNRSIENSLWPQLLSTRRDKLLTKALNEIFSLTAEQVQLLPTGQLMVLFENFSLPLDSQGDGTRTALRALMVLAMIRNSLLIFEEPECHQHPGSLERYARAVCVLAREQEVQLLISTHSAECVRAFLNAARQVKSEAEVFHLTLTDGELESRRLDAEAVETLQSSGLDIRFLDLYA